MTTVTMHTVHIYKYCTYVCMRRLHMYSVTIQYNSYVSGYTMTHCHHTVTILNDQVCKEGSSL